MKNVSRVILALVVAVFGFASLVFDAGTGALRVGNITTGVSRVTNQITSTNNNDTRIDNADNIDNAYNDNADNNNDNADDNADNIDNAYNDNADNNNDNANDNNADNSNNNSNKDNDSAAVDANKDSSNDVDNANKDSDDDVDDANKDNDGGAGDDKSSTDETPLSELDKAKLDLTQVMNDFVKVYSQFDFSIYIDRNGRECELYGFGYLYTNGRFNTDWLKSSNVYDYQVAIASMKSLTALVTEVLRNARKEVPAPNLVSFEKYFESIDDYINQLNADYEPLTYVTCQKTRPSK